MKIKKLEADLLYNKDIHLTIIASDGDFNTIHGLSRLSEEEIQKYDLRIEKKRKKRSLDANAYAWALINKLAEKLRSTSEEVYQECIRKYGFRTIVLVKNDLLKDVMTAFNNQGLGNYSEVIGQSQNNKNGTNVQLYFGSSKYDTKQMARFIDGIVSDCKEQGIETMTPEEIEKLKVAWRSNEQS
ncbi:hypothetical protein [Gallibacter intestinalis]|uniref:Uncharacterized protein n=1 Tax=Gallibacter intestinalis TaxID=2779356 RepID=A0ABR9QZ64_9FIRM|nr:hypothetical protein [Gallibacter intestinalis]MBE5036182.1 hypothetical protein [Gallibacter intestinalis]